VHRGGALASDYGFDDNGNRTTHRIGPASPLRDRSWPCLGALPAGADVTVSGTYDAQDRMSSYGSCTYEYTRNGELTRRVDSATSSTTEYDYDEFGNLRRVVLPDTRVITYHIDGMNRRVGKSIDGVRQWGLLYANQLEPVAELNASGAVVASFIYADRPHVPSLMLKGGQTYRILADHLGSVRLVVHLATGAIAQRMSYDEYGNVVEDTNPGFQPFGYAGGIYDRDTGLVRFGARDYDAVTGRWTAKDPIRFLAGVHSFYSYVGSNPLNLIDPTGLVDINLVSPWESAHKGLGVIQSPSGVLTVGVHYDGISFFEGNQRISLERLGELIRSHPRYNEVSWVKLYSCNVGRDTDGSGPAAEKLAELIDRGVQGPGSYTGIGETQGFLGLFSKENGTLVPNPDGQWINFKPSSWE
jgi:RHS repeat-associated protein